jgi:hypothetical protein
MCVFWCILHLNEYFPKHQATLSSGSRPLKKAPSLPAATSLAGNDTTPHAAAPSLTAAPVAVQQQHDEPDVPHYAATDNIDINAAISPTKESKGRDPCKPCRPHPQ